MLDLHVRGARAARRSGNDDLGDQLSGLERGRERPEEELRCRKRPFRSPPRAEHESCAEREQRRPACRTRGRRGRGFRRACPRLRTCRSPISPRALGDRRERAAARSSGALASSSQVVSAPIRSSLVSPTSTPRELEPADVHENARPDDPQLHDREERLTACERLRVRVGESSSASSSERGANVARRPRGSRRCPFTQRRCRGAYRLHDRLVPGAAAEVSLERAPDRRVVGIRHRARGDRTQSGSSPACRSRIEARGARRTLAESGGAPRRGRTPRSSSPPGHPTEPRASCSS